ncbi:MAG: hypothetical protein H7A32_05030 [Deltaproteobacteria bacterium]|nr:hypothetical protein [Deltaproteobacteria bacterium]
MPEKNSSQLSSDKVIGKDINTDSHNADLLSEEESEMFRSSRRKFFMGFIVPFTMAVSTCSNSSNSAADQVAEQYMRAYYIQYDVKKALPLTEGLAKDKLEDQSKLLDEAPSDAPLQRPQAHFTLKSKEEGGPQEVSYTYIVEVEKQDIPPRRIFLQLREDGSQNWKVSQVVEFEPGQSGNP